MICLGIESTAHTFSIGIINDEKEILSIASDIFIPDEGGLTPQKLVEHHYSCFEKVLINAFKNSKRKIKIEEIDLIAFSRGPGLGRCLAIGAALARSLALKLNIPIVGVNHCIAHIEIGRSMCNIEDPLTLYVSGGNTIISAFESGKYQIFGETLDIAIGNMLDRVARDLKIPHPGGPEIEKIAKKGKQYISLPYTVKGMDLSFSGLFVATRRALVNNYEYNRNNEHNEHNEHNEYNEPNEPKGKEKKFTITTEDIIYSLQETAFAMLAEVCERALAHTQKRSVLLTGGVAANQRLQEMIAEICKEHNASFYVVPNQLAGDNGAMIAWTGILKFNAVGNDFVNNTRLLPKWRMDEVDIPWRKKIKEKNYKSLISIKKNKKNKKNKIFQKGAEANIRKVQWFGREAVEKHRIIKTYRESLLDNEIRYKRTIKESKILINLAFNGVPVPIVYSVNPLTCKIIMQQIFGTSLKELLLKNEIEKPRIKIIFKRIGKFVAKIHQNNYVHGDLTTSNIILTNNSKIYFIDFGLAKYNSGDIEEMAMDLHVFKRVILSTHGMYFDFIFYPFLDGYRDYNTKSSQILKKIVAQEKIIDSRGRYNPKIRRRKV